MKTYLLHFFFLVAIVLPAQDLQSPNGRIRVTVDAREQKLTIRYPSGESFDVETGIRIDGENLPRGRGKVGDVISVDRKIQPTVATKRSEIHEHYNQRVITYSGGLELVVRVYDQGVAYRYRGLPAGKLDHEDYLVRLDPDTKLFYPTETSFYSHNERTYNVGRPAELTPKLASLPALAELPSGEYLWLNESDLHDFPGLWLDASEDGLYGAHPGLPNEIRDTSDREQAITRHKHLAELEAGAKTPWRLFGVAEQAHDLLDNQLTFLTAAPAEGDFSWVRPGQVAWDWYNALMLTGVDFESGVNTASYKYFVDFASENEIPYVILDEGWSPTLDLLTQVPEVDVKEIIAYAEARGVGIILWVLWEPLMDDLDNILATYAEWGVRGVKVDFLQRDDQLMVNHYWDMARVAAEHELLVNFHGSYKPAGLHRTYPNVITREGLKGLEWYKFGNPGSKVGPDHNCTLPFIRMVAGPMDFTPGAMSNAQLDAHQYNFEHPTSLGTRCHQLAMYVVYESPLQMLADSPTSYEAEPEITDFITGIPTVWEQTWPLAGAVGDYAAVARLAKNGDYYLAALNDWDARELKVQLDFLPPGDYRIEIFQDGPNHVRHAEDYQRTVGSVAAGQTLTLPLGQGGGWVARLRPR